VGKSKRDRQRSFTSKLGKKTSEGKKGPWGWCNRTREGRRVATGEKPNFTSSYAIRQAIWCLFQGEGGRKLMKSGLGREDRLFTSRYQGEQRAQI